MQAAGVGKARCPSKGILCGGQNKKFTTQLHRPLRLIGEREKKSGKLIVVFPFKTLCQRPAFPEPCSRWPVPTTTEMEWRAPAKPRE